MLPARVLRFFLTLDASRCGVVRHHAARRAATQRIRCEFGLNFATPRETRGNPTDSAYKRPSVAVRAATSSLRISGRLKNCAEPPTNGCSTSSSATNTTFCTIYCRRNLKRLNVTICARAHPTLNYQNVVRVSQTRLVTLNACYSRIFTKCCSTLLTELTVLTVK